MTRYFQQKRAKSGASTVGYLELWVQILDVHNSYDIVRVMDDTILLPLLRSRTQGDLLALLFLNPGRSFSITEAAKRIGVSRPGLSQEARRLSDSGFILSSTDGRSNKITANENCIISKPLTDLLAVTYGPLPVLNREFSGINGIDSAYIFGSWAARYLGNTGPIPADVDVLIVGVADRDELDVAAQRAEEVLLREVNVRRISAQAWEKGEEAFLKTVRSSPLVPLSLSESQK